MKKITFLLLTLLFFVPNVWSQCESAIALTPGTDQSGDTSSFGELFSDTCLGSYDGGYDGLFSYVASEDGESLSISLTSSNSWTGVSISEGCPSGGGSCIVSDTYGTSFSLDSGPLTAGVTYYVHFSTWPSPDAIQYTLTSTVSPPANCPTAAISSFPYSNGFENLDCWTNSNSSAAWAIGQGDDYGPGSVTEGANSVFFNDYDYSTGSTGDLMSPDFDFGALTTARVSFDYWDSSGDDVVEVLVDDGSGPVVVFTTEDAVSTWTNIYVDLPQYATQTVKIGFRGTSVFGTTNPHIDNFMISEAPSCLAPLALSAASITATSAEISWTAGGTETDYEYVVQAAGTGEPTAAGTAVNGATTVSASGLVANTDYEVYVRSNCGSEFSSWAGPVSFTTACSAVSDFSENFDSVTTPNLPNCWSSILDVSSSYASVGTSTAADSSSPNGVSLYNSSSTSGDIILVSPELSNLAGGTHRLKLDASNSSSTQDLEIGTLSDPTDGSTFTLIETVDLSATFLEYTIDFSTYSGNDNYIGFRRILSSTYTYVYLDNIVWEEIPSCVEPTAVSAASITATSAEISWTSDDSSFNVEVVDVTAGGTATGTATNSGVTSPYSLSGLDSNTEYEVYVQTDCGAGDTSAWEGPVSFTTEPAPIVPNYTNDFATFPGEFWSVGSGALNAGPSGTTSLWETGNFAHGSVDPAAYINIFSTTRDEWLISPSFDLSGVNYYLNVDVAATEYLSISSSAAPVDAIWGVDDFVTLMVSEDGGSTWTELYRWDANNNPGVAGAAMPEINLSAYPALAKFAFYAESTVFNEDIDFFVDNFQITTTSLGIEEASISQFTYFPNPVNDVLTIKAQKVVEDITVFNMLGQVVKQQTPNTRDCTVDLSAMQSGAYFVKVSIGNNVETVRVLKK